MKIRKSLLELTSETYASDNTFIPDGAVDCTAGCNPYGNHPALFEVVKNADTDMIYNYPHDQSVYEEIGRFWSEFADVKRENIVISDGSMAVLSLIANIFDEPGAKTLSVAPTFTDATLCYKSRGMKYRFVPLDADKGYAFDTDSVLSEMNAEDSLLYIDNPNNPTGQTIPLAELEKLVAHGSELGIAVVIDEAYGDFIPPGESATCLLGRYDNIIVVRTFSKGFGMAGMRAGYLMADPLVTSSINKMSDPYNMNELARRMGTAALRHGDFALAHTDDFIKSKQMLKEVTGHNIKMAVTDDRVPIALLWHEDPEVDLSAELIKNGVVTVSAVEFDCLGKNAVRLRVPTLDDMEKVCQAVAAVNG